MNRKILLTGATSFLGKHLLPKLLARGEDVFASARHEDKELNIEGMDLLKADKVKSIVDKARPSVVLHLAALVNLSRDYNIAQKCLDINIGGTLNLLESLRIAKPERMVFISTEEIYGSGAIPYVEDQSFNPPSGYAISKIAGELFCRMYSRELGFNLIILRIGTMYGPGDRSSRFIPQMIIKALKNEEILLNSGRKKRDYVYVDDAVQSLINVLNAKDLESQAVFNIGGGKSYSLLELAKVILKETGSSSEIATGKIPERVGEADEWLMDIKRADDFLKWKPQVSLEEGLKRTIKYFRSNLK